MGCANTMFAQPTLLRVIDFKTMFLTLRKRAGYFALGRICKLLGGGCAKLTHALRATAGAIHVFEHPDRSNRSGAKGNGARREGRGRSQCIVHLSLSNRPHPYKKKTPPWGVERT